MPVIKEPALPNSGMRLAMLLTAIDQCDNEFALERDDYKTLTLARFMPQWIMAGANQGK